MAEASNETLSLSHGLIFDFNGTLVDDGSLHEQTWGEVIAARWPGRYDSEQIGRLIRGRANRDIVAALLGTRVSEDELIEIAGDKEARYRDRLRRSAFRLAPGAEAFLTAMAEQGRPLALATLAPPENLACFDELLGLGRWFRPEAMICDDGSFPGKPAPDIFLKAAAALGLAPADCTVFGDSPADMTAAALAGIGRIIHVDLGGGTELLPGAHARISDYTGLLT